MEAIKEYDVIRLIGRGGMGAVYEVRHRALGVRYALKTFTLEHGEVDFLRERFVAEARTLARLRHPNIARVSDLGVMDDGTAYFVMDLVLDPNGEPRTLEDVSPDEFTDSDRLRWLESIASALDCIHAEGIVHRDVKASNILLNAKNDAVLVDFGISRYEHGRIKREIGVEKTVVAGDEESARRLVMGTGGYLAPEIRKGGEASAASDVYSLGVVFFRLLTGLWYEPGTDALRLLEPLEGTWSRLLPPMLAADPAKRPVRLVEFLREVRTNTVRPRRAVLTRLAIIGCLLAVIASTLLFFSTRSNKTPPLPHSPTPPLSHSSTPPLPHSSTTPLTFDLGDGVSIEMVECRGTSAAPFWIGASHVTNGEWLRVTGNKRDGADDEPAVAMSMNDVSKFIAELNRRFAAHLPRGCRFRLPSTNELVTASTAGGANAADASALGVAGPSVADKKAHAAEKGAKWESIMAKMPCRVRTKNPNAWGVYDIVGQGRTICRETEGADEKGRPKHVQLGPDDIAERSLVGEWGWNTTLRLALGEE